MAILQKQPFHSGFHTYRRSCYNILHTYKRNKQTKHFMSTSSCWCAACYLLSAAARRATTRCYITYRHQNNYHSSTKLLNSSFSFIKPKRLSLMELCMENTFFFLRPPLWQPPQKAKQWSKGQNDRLLRHHHHTTTTTHTSRRCTRGCALPLRTTQAWVYWS